MRRRITVFLLIMVLLLTLPAPVASASSGARSSRERDNSELSIQSEDVPLLELPASEIFAEAAADGNGEAVTQVAAEQLMEAIETVASGDTVSIMISVTSNSANEPSSISVVIPGEALSAVAEQTDAEMSVVSDLGRITLANAAVASLAAQSEGADITVTMSQQGASGQQLSILSGGKEIVGWDGETPVINKLPGALVGSESGPVVVSPLIARTEEGSAGDAGMQMHASYICLAAAVLTPVVCVMFALVMKRRQRS